MYPKLTAFLRIILILSVFLVLLSPLEFLSTTGEQPGISHIPADHQCRMWGIISTNAPSSVIRDHLYILTNSIKYLGDDRNPDGWSVGYYPDGNIDPTVNRGYPQAFTDDNFNDAADEAANATPRIALSHVRDTSSGTTPLSGNPHPFERVINSKHWLLEHNGTISKTLLRSLIRDDFFALYPPQYGTNMSSWIDSDLYQILVLQTIQDYNWQVKPALGHVIRELQDGGATNLNIILTDGTTLWAYREGDSIHTLYYRYVSSGTPYTAVASEPPSDPGSWTALGNERLLTAYQNHSPEVEDIEYYFFSHAYLPLVIK